MKSTNSMTLRKRFWAYIHSRLCIKLHLHSHILKRSSKERPVAMTKSELVFVPSPAFGHIGSMIELAKRFVDRDERLSATVLVISSPFVPAIERYIQAVAVSDPRVRFIHIPLVETTSSSKSPEKSFSRFLEGHKPNIEHAIATIKSDSSVRLTGIVFDMICTFMIDVANQLGIPSYLFFPSGAAFLGLMLYLPIRHNQVGAEFDPLDPESIIQSYVNPVPTNVMPSFTFCKEGGYTTIVDHATRYTETKGIIINTFTELQPHAVSSIITPPLYPVGPLLDLEGQKHSTGSGPNLDEIIMFLSDQPPSSVVFLCFGSVFTFDAPQLVQIAMALEASGQRFLWSIRWPPPKYTLEENEYPTIQEVLPEGFFERTEKKGMVCGWAPQVEVLAHPAVGGFVSHCGWNSTLESLWYGVPIATWPLYAEQQINAFELLRELELAVELKLDSSFFGGKVVMADEIERAIKVLMDSENPLREKVKEMSKKSRKAVMDGGSSYASLGRLIEDILGNTQLKD